MSSRALILLVAILGSSCSKAPQSAAKVSEEAQPIQENVQSGYLCHGPELGRTFLVFPRAESVLIRGFKDETYDKSPVQNDPIWNKFERTAGTELRYEIGLGEVTPQGGLSMFAAKYSSATGSYSYYETLGCSRIEQEVSAQWVYAQGCIDHVSETVQNDIEQRLRLNNSEANVGSIVDIGFTLSNWDEVNLVFRMLTYDIHAPNAQPFHDFYQVRLKTVGTQCEVEGTYSVENSFANWTPAGAFYPGYPKTGA